MSTRSSPRNKAPVSPSNGSTDDLKPGASDSATQTADEARETTTEAQTEGEGCPVCLSADRAPSARRPRPGAARISCANHWQCIATRNDSLELIDKWYCAQCVADSGKAGGKRLKTVYKAAQRKSVRTSTNKINYANLDNHLPADVGKWLKVAETRPMVENAFKSYRGSELTDEWVWNNPDSFREPFLIEKPDGLDMRMPPRDTSIQRISELVGPDTPIEVIDVASQSSLAHWTLQQWANYYEDSSRDKIRNVISLEISETPFGDMVEAPRFVRNMDWVETVWPADLKGTGQYPKVQKYCLMSVKRCWTDWHVDFAGSSVYYHILRGGKVFYFIRPTPENLLAYERWSGSQEKQENTWLGDDVDCVYKVTLQPGNTMIIPTGWPHAVFTPSDSLVIGGNFLHSLNIGTQLRVYAIELATKVPRKFRFPHFVKMLWFACHSYAHRIAYSLSTKSRQLPIDINGRVLEGLKELSEFLIEQSGRVMKTAPVSAERRRIARENVPWDVVPDPIALSRQLRMLVLQARGEPIDDLCMPPAEYHEAYSYGVEASRPSSRSASVAVSSPPKPTKPTKRQLDKINNAQQEIAAKGVTAGPVHGVDNGSAPYVYSAPSGPAVKRPRKDPGEIISKTSAPTSSIDKDEMRVDPTNPAAGPQMAHVKHSQSATTTVKKFVEASGEVVIESKMVVTTVERVKFPAAGAVPTTAYAQSPYYLHHHQASINGHAPSPYGYYPGPGYVQAYGGPVNGHAPPVAPAPSASGRPQRMTSFPSDRMQEYDVRDVPPSVKGWVPMAPPTLPLPLPTTGAQGKLSTASTVSPGLDAIKEQQQAQQKLEERRLSQHQQQQHSPPVQPQSLDGMRTSPVFNPASAPVRPLNVNVPGDVDPRPPVLPPPSSSLSSAAAA
ncbi:hypothetical protein ACM66B_000453 [Microbotryomycetes sp. NB124-2]